MRGLFMRGRFTADDAHAAAATLMAYTIGLIPFVLIRSVVAPFLARGDTATPVKIGLGAVALNLALNLAFMRPLQWVGPALATSLAAMANVAGLWIMLARRGQLTLDLGLRFRLPRMVAAAAAMAAVLWLGERSLFAPFAARPGWRWIALSALVGLGMAAYFAAAHLLGAVDLRLTGASLLRRRARSADA